MRSRSLNAIKHYQSGDYLGVCDICGFTYYASELRLNYRNLRVCHRDFETRNPQDFVKYPIGIKPPWTRPKALVVDSAYTLYTLPGFGVFQEIAASQNYNIPGFGVFVGVE